MFKTKKSFCTMIAVTFLMVTVLAACTPPKPAQEFILRTGVVSTPGILPYAAIMDRGLDKKYGIQFVETSYVSSTAMLDALAAGSLDVGIGVGTISLFSAFQNGLIPNKVVVGAAMSFSDPAHPFTGVLVAPSINSWQDLKGKQIGVPALTGPPAAGIKGRLRLEGISDYTLVEIAIPNLGLSVAGGNIAAAVVAEPYLTQSLLRKDGKLLGWVIGGVPFEKLEVNVVTFSATLYRENPQAVKAFLKAYLEAVKWIDRNPDDARLLIGNKLSLSTEVTSKMAMPQWSLDGRNDPTSLESMQSVLLDVGMLKAPIPVNQLYDETLLEEVLKEKH